MHGIENIVTTVMWEAQVEKALSRPWVERIFKMAAKILMYTMMMRDNGTKRRIKPKMKSTWSFTEVSAQANFKTAGTSQKKWLISLGPQ
jgi:hypothetical protein